MSIFTKTHTPRLKHLLKLHNRYLWTGQRYQGYVNYFNADQLFGFVVRDDAPEKEYYFHATDLQTDGVPRVRPYQNVEFSIHEGRGSNFIARDVSDYDGNQLQFYHANMRLASEHRTKKLSDMPNGEHERHTGVIVSLYPDGNGGLIVPDRLNYDTLMFRVGELQTTGVERVDRFAEVEFYARKPPNSSENQRDFARCITRRGGQLITAERREKGADRRRLGSMYGPNDTKARIPNEYGLNRERGYVLDYNPSTLFGFIVSFEDPSKSVFVHIDDCHIFGKRILRRYQEVEFNRIKDETSEKEKALHVSGINKTILRGISSNYYLTQEFTTTKLDINNDIKYKGCIIKPLNDNRSGFCIIKPNDMGYEPCISWNRNILSLGRKDLRIGDEVEFNVEKNLNEDSILVATNVTAGGGKPIIGAFGELNNYYRDKINAEVDNNLNEEVSNTKSGEKLKGYICSYSRVKKGGLIEIERKDKDKRYRKVYFDLDDCIIDNNIDTEKNVPLIGSKIECEIIDNTKTIYDMQGAIIETPNITKRATKISSIRIDRSNNTYKEIHEDTLRMIELKTNTKDNTHDDHDDDDHDNKNNDDQKTDIKKEELTL